MPSDAAKKVWRDELAYAIKLVDWAAGEGFVRIEGLEDPEEWCFRMWLGLGPPNGDGYTADALAAAVIDRAIADAVEQERARIERIKGYAVHDDTCEDHGAYPGSCTCGLSRLLKEIGI